MLEKTIIDVFIINYNGKNTILPTIESLYNSDDITVNISVIDDYSCDESTGMIKKCFPDIPIYVMPYNTRQANILRNKAIQMAKSEFVFITDNDIKYDNRCLAEMLDIMRSDNAIASCTPRLMYWDQPDKVYMAGTKVHYIGAAISEKRDKIYIPEDNVPSVNSGSGICLLRKNIALQVGSFDINFMQGWGSDGEFYQRMLRAGYKCVYVPTAFGLHEDKLQITTRKFRVVGATYNRWFFILSHYSVGLIILMIPVLILYETFQVLFVIKNGVLSQYLKGNSLVIRNFKLIREKRRFVKKLKIVSDTEVLYSGNLYVSPSLQNNKIIKVSVNLFSYVLNLYWLIIKKLVPDIKWSHN